MVMTAIGNNVVCEDNGKGKYRYQRGDKYTFSPLRYIIAMKRTGIGIRDARKLDVVQLLLDYGVEYDTDFDPILTYVKVARKVIAIQKWAAICGAVYNQRSVEQSSIYKFHTDVMYDKQMWMLIFEFVFYNNDDEEKRNIRCVPMFHNEEDDGYTTQEYGSGENDIDYNDEARSNEKTNVMCDIDGYTTQEWCSSGESDPDNHSDVAILNTHTNPTQEVKHTQGLCHSQRRRLN
jgi:hypothetical protein